MKMDYISPLFKVILSQMSNLDGGDLYYKDGGNESY